MKECGLCVSSCEGSHIIKEKGKILTFEKLDLKSTRAVAQSCSLTLKGLSGVDISKTKKSYLYTQ